MKRQAGSIEPSELNEVAGLVKQAATVIDHMLVLNTSIDAAASGAIAQYRNEARVAEDAANRLISGVRELEADRERRIASLQARVAELEAVVAQQKQEIEALRLLVWPKANTATRADLPGK